MFIPLGVVPSSFLLSSSFPHVLFAKLNEDAEKLQSGFKGGKKEGKTAGENQLGTWLPAQYARQGAKECVKTKGKGEQRPLEEVFMYNLMLENGGFL